MRNNINSGPSTYTNLWDNQINCLVKLHALFITHTNLLCTMNLAPGWNDTLCPQLSHLSVRRRRPQGSLKIKTDFRWATRSVGTGLRSIAVIAERKKKSINLHYISPLPSCSVRSSVNEAIRMAHFSLFFFLFCLSLSLLQACGRVKTLANYNLNGPTATYYYQSSQLELLSRPVLIAYIKRIWKNVCVRIW